MESISELGKLEHIGETRIEKTGLVQRLLKPGFHLQMAYASAAMLTFDVVGCAVTHVKVPNILAIVTALAVVLGGMQALPVYWHSKGKNQLRDAALTVPWFALFIVLLPYVQDIAAKLGRGLPLQDATFVRFDELLGVHVPSLIAWASRSDLGHLVNRSYPLLVPLIYLSCLLPVFLGKAERAEEFVIANFLFVFLGTPIFMLLPAVGPWFGYHISAGPGQRQCQADLFLMRQSGPYLHRFVGVVCCPSGHVMGAILAAYSLWIFRPLRIPTAILSGVIILSTMTTGWHYFFDVLGGALLAFATIVLARSLTRFNRRANSF